MSLDVSSAVLPRRSGRHFVVTGAGTGIGQTIAVRLAREGAAVSLFGRRIERPEETAGLIRAVGAHPAFLQSCNVDDATPVEAAFSVAAHARGPIDVLFANAGIGGANTPGEGDRFFALGQTNLVGTYHCVRAAQRHLTPGPAARHIVVTSSILGRFGVPGYTGYGALKTALIGLVRALALELAEDHVLVNAICPGWVATDMAWEGIEGMAKGMGITPEPAVAQAMAAVPLGWMACPEEIAGMVAWLLSADAAGVTGQAIDQNGGAWMG